MGLEDLEPGGVVRLQYGNWLKATDKCMIGILTGRTTDRKDGYGVRAEVQWSDGSLLWPAIEILYRLPKKEC